MPKKKDDQRMRAIALLSQALLNAQAKGEATAEIIGAIAHLSVPPKPPLHSGKVSPKVRAARDAHIQQLYREGTPMRSIQGMTSEWSSPKGYHLYEILRALRAMPDREAIKRRNLSANVVDIAHAREPKEDEAPEVDQETVQVIWSMRRQGVVPAAIARHLRVERSVVDSVLERRGKSEKAKG